MPMAQSEWILVFRDTILFHIVAIEFLDLNFGPHGNLVIKVIILLRKRCLEFSFFPPIVPSHFCPVQNPVKMIAETQTGLKNGRGTPVALERWGLWGLWSKYGGWWDWWSDSRAGDLRPKRERADSLEKWIFSTASWKSPKNRSFREWRQKWIMCVPSQELMTLKQMLCSAEPLGREEEMVIWVCLSYWTILLGLWLSGDLPRLNRAGDCSRKSLSLTAFVSPPSKLLDFSNLAHGEFCCLGSTLIFIYANEALLLPLSIDQSREQPER